MLSDRAVQSSRHHLNSPRWPGLLMLLASLLLAPRAASVTFEEAAQAVARAATSAAGWFGPVKGPRAQAGKSIVVLAEDLRNGGVLGVSQGIREAAREIGWQVRI